MTEEGEAREERKNEGVELGEGHACWSQPLLHIIVGIQSVG